jgi:hypothetical protein
MTRRAALALAAALAALTACAAAAAAPRGYDGTLEITHHMQARADQDVEAEGFVSVRGSYRLRGFRWRGPGYLMLGSGEERVNALANFTKSDPENSSAYQFRASSRGTVHLVSRPRRARQTSGLILRLLPRGRFALSLIPLDAGQPGNPLEYVMSRSDRQSCITSPAFRSGEMSYENGRFEAVERSRCPDEEPSPDRREGRAVKGHTIWGANVWASHANPIRQDFCRHVTTGNQNLTLCGRVRDGGHLRGRVAQDGGNPHFVQGGCPFEPWGPGGLPHPLDGIGTACTVMPIGGPDWATTTRLRWKLRPLR